MKHPSIRFDRYVLPKFCIASADFCLTKDITMPDGTVYRQGKKYFSYPEILSIIEFMNLLNHKTCGYLIDLPTYEEYEQIIGRFGFRDGAIRSYHLASALGLGFYGSIGIIRTLDDYNQSPQDFTYEQAIGYGITGYYLCKNTDRYEDQASILCMNSCYEPSFIQSIIDNGANTGYSVRLVKRFHPLPSRP